MFKRIKCLFKGHDYESITIPRMIYDNRGTLTAYRVKYKCTRCGKVKIERRYL